MADRAMTPDEARREVRDFRHAAQAVFRDKVYGAMREAERLADNMRVRIGAESAEEVFAAFLQELGVRWAIQPPAVIPAFQVFKRHPNGDMEILPIEQVLDVLNVVHVVTA